MFSIFKKFTILHPPSEDSWVRVRVWLPETETKEIEDVSKNHTEIAMLKKETKNVGHVSLETANIYASLWPDPDDPQDISINSKHKALFVPSNEMDERLEGKPADYIIDLYTLDARKIESKFKQLREATLYWQLFGRNRIVGIDGQNCSGQTFELLESGNESQFSKVIAGKTYTTPASILRCVMEYKQLELSQFPEAKYFHPPIKSDIASPKTSN